MTPAVFELQRSAVDFTIHEFEPDPAERSYGLAAATALGVESDRVFKTLLAEVWFGSDAPLGTTTRARVVAIVPVGAQLSLKALAASVGAKRAEMCPPADAERVTGYVVGGISPFGQKRRLRTVIDETCELADSIFVSAGRRGLDVELAPRALIDQLEATVAAIAVR